MPQKDLLLVIDMQNVYTQGQPWACCRTDRAAAAIRTLLDADGPLPYDRVIFTRFLPPQQPQGTWVGYNELNAAINADAFANAMMPEFLPYLQRWPLADKSVYSSFACEEVRRAAADARRVAVTGVVAECCVLSTVLAGIDAGCHMVYLRDAVSGLSEQNEAYTAALVESFGALHTTVTDTAQYLRGMV